MYFWNMVNLTLRESPLGNAIFLRWCKEIIRDKIIFISSTWTIKYGIRIEDVNSRSTNRCEQMFIFLFEHQILRTHHRYSFSLFSDEHILWNGLERVKASKMHDIGFRGSLSSDESDEVLIVSDMCWILKNRTDMYIIKLRIRPIISNRICEIEQWHEKTGW